MSTIVIAMSTIGYVRMLPESVVLLIKPLPKIRLKNAIVTPFPRFFSAIKLNTNNATTVSV